MNMCLSNCFILFYFFFRKLLKDDQLEAGTKAAQQEEMERRKRLEQQRKDFPTPAPPVPDPQLGDYCLQSAVIDLFIPSCTSLDLSSDKLHLSILPTVDTASILGEVSRLVPGFLAKQDVICLDSSGDEEEKVEPKLPALDIRDGKMFETLTPLWSTLISDFFNSVRS